MCACSRHSLPNSSQVVGDRVFAWWNAPTRCARAEFNAVRCALAVVSQWDSRFRSPTHGVPEKVAASRSPAAPPTLPPPGAVRAAWAVTDVTEVTSENSPHTSENNMVQSVSNSCGDALSSGEGPVSARTAGVSPPEPPAKIGAGLRVGIASSGVTFGNMGSDMVKVALLLSPPSPARTHTHVRTRQTPGQRQTKK